MAGSDKKCIYGAKRNVFLTIYFDFCKSTSSCVSHKRDKVEHVVISFVASVVVSTATFHARVRGSFPGLGGLK